MDGTCRWCGENHGKLCPWVKALEFNGIGDTVTRVEFVTSADFARRAPVTDDDPPPADYPKLGER